MVNVLKKVICRTYLSYVFTCRISSNFSLYIFFSVSFLIFNLFRPHSDPINSLANPPTQSQHKSNTRITTDTFLHPIVISLTDRLPEGVPIEDQFWTISTTIWIEKLRCTNGWSAVSSWTPLTKLPVEPQSQSCQPKQVLQTCHDHCRHQQRCCCCQWTS